MVILYSTHCSRCVVLEKKLKEKNINFQEINDTKTIIDKGILSVPYLEVDGQMMDFNQAIQWVNEQ